MVGSVSSSRRTFTTSVWPYCAAQCSAVSLSLFCRVTNASVSEPGRTQPLHASLKPLKFKCKNKTKKQLGSREPSLKQSLEQCFHQLTSHLPGTDIPSWTHQPTHPVKASKTFRTISFTQIWEICSTGNRCYIWNSLLSKHWGQNQGTKLRFKGLSSCIWIPINSASTWGRQSYLFAASHTLECHKYKRVQYTIRKLQH